MKDFTEYKQSVYDLIGAAMEVHNLLGFGLLEPVYQAALSREFVLRNIPHQREYLIETYYKGYLLDKLYKADFVVGDIIIELKALSEISAEHRAQLCNYLRLTKRPVGLLINFGTERLYGERWVYDEQSNLCYKVNKDMRPIDEC